MTQFEPIEIEVVKIVIVEYNPDMWPRLEFITKGGQHYGFYSEKTDDGQASVWVRPIKKVPKEIKKN